MTGKSSEMIAARASTVLWADTVGTQANDRLASGKGVVHSAFDQALNLLFPGGIVSVVQRSKGMGPLNVTLPDRESMGLARSAKPGSRVSIERGLISVGDLRISLDHASHYETPALFSHRPIGRGRVLRNVSDAQEMIIRVGKLEGLGAMLYPLRGRAVPPPLTSPYLDRALKAVLSFSRRFSSGDEGGAVASASELIGMGIGLTPSGDDLLSGALAALSLGSNNGVRGKADLREVADGVVRAGRDRTTLLSQTYLEQASAGRVNEHLYGFAEGLYAGSEATLRESLTSLVHLGATSGTDTAVGATLGATIASGAEVTAS